MRTLPISFLVFWITFIPFNASHASLNLKKDKSLIVYGDFRLRWEDDWDSLTVTGTPRQDRHRLRHRIRVGTRIESNNDFKANFRLRTSDRNAHQSSHITLWQGPKFDRDLGDLIFDRAYVRWNSGEKTYFSAGRNGLNIWMPSEILWDDDVYVDGIGWNSDRTPMAFHLGLFFLPDGVDDHSLNKKSQLATGQVVYTIEGNTSSWKLAQAALFLRDNWSSQNTSNDDLNYAISVTNIQYACHYCHHTPVALGIDIFINLLNGTARDREHDRFGCHSYAQIGKLDDTGNWLLGLYGAWIEKWAIPRFMAQDAWFRFGSRGQTRSSDYYGYEVRAGLKLSRNVTILSRAFLVESISNSENGKRFRFDITVDL